jgi:hypothetical protein
VSPLSPAERGVSLNGNDGSAVGEDRKLVVVRLLTEDLEARKGGNTSGDALLLEELSGLDSDGDLGTGGDDGDVGVLGLDEDVTTLVGLLDGGTGELGKVLAGEATSARGESVQAEGEAEGEENARKDGGSVGGGKSHVVRGGGLVTVSGAPDVAVGEGAEVSDSLDRLVSRAVLYKRRDRQNRAKKRRKRGKRRRTSETDGVVGGNPDNTLVGDEVEESSDGGDHEVGAVSGDTVGDGTHAVLTDTVAL